MRSILFLFASLLLFSSCMTTENLYQVNRAKTSEGEKDLEYSNDEVAISYDLWAEKGEFYFTVKNLRTDSFLWVDKGNSSLVVNGESKSYYNNLITTTEHSKSDYNSYFNMWGSGGTEVEKSSSTTKKEKRYVAIPPNARIVFVEGTISDQLGHKMELGEKTKVEKEFTQEGSPLTVQNYLYYYKDKDHEDEGILKSSFHVDKITVMEEGLFIEDESYPYRKANAYYYQMERKKFDGVLMIAAFGIPALVLIPAIISASQ